MDTLKHFGLVALLIIAVALSGCLGTEDVIRPTTSYYNYTNTTGGGGVSFNGSAVDLNGSSLYNGTVPSDNSKVNKSGDIIYGSFLQNRTVSGSDSLIGSSAFVDLTPLGLNFYGRTLTFFSVNRWYNETALGYRNGTYSNKTGAGFLLDSNAGAPGASGRGNYKPKFYIFGFPENSTAYYFWFMSDEVETELRMGNFTIELGNLTVKKLNGSGNAYVCVDSTGKLYRGSPTC